MFSREFQSTCLALRSLAIRTGNPPPKRGQVLSDQWPGRRDLSRKDFYWSAGQYDLNDRSLQLGQARDGH